MINKDQLQELIQQGVTIYKLNHFANKIETVLLDKKDYIGIGFLNEDVYVRGNPELIFYGAWYKLEDLFETEEDALWELEMTATRTETLKMPKWEDIEFDEIGYYIKKFHIKDNYDFFGKLMITKEKIYVEEMVIGYQKKIYFEKSITKENYIEACKLCLKMFKGEK